MSEFQPGSKLKVRYDPEEPSRVAVEETERGTSYLPDEGEGNSTLFIILISILPAPILFLIFFYLPQRRRRKILQTGVPAEAVVLKIEDTLTRINRQPKVRLSLEVRPKDKEVFQVEMTTVISPAHLAEFKSGSKLQVRYDPNDRSRIAIEKSAGGGQFRY